VVALGCALTPATAYGWERPIRLPHNGGGVVPRVAVDRHGTTRVLGSGADSGQYRVHGVAARSRRVTTCRVPGSYPANLSHPGVGWAAADSGAMALAFTTGSDRTWVGVTSARAGGCFRRPERVSSRKGSAELKQLALGPLGTVLAQWRDLDATADHRARYVTGPAGGSLARPRRLQPASAKRGFFTYASAGFAARDRVVWAALVGQPIGDGSSFRERLFGATSGPRAGRRGPFRLIARGDFARDVAFKVFTTRRGGQVAAGVNDGGLGGKLLVTSRRPGRAFQAPKIVTMPSNAHLSASAMNAAGDAVFVLDDEHRVYVVIRRRGGRIAAIRSVPNAHGFGVVKSPAVAIDPSGRAVVAWVAQNLPNYNDGPGEVQVASAGHDGRFGPATRISGPRRRNFVFPNVAVNGKRRVAVTYQYEKVAPKGVVGVQTYLVRGRLGR
jgi:hypothetical protein